MAYPAIWQDEYQIKFHELNQQIQQEQRACFSIQTFFRPGVADYNML